MRFAIGLLLLKQIYGLSDEGVCERWVYDPYFQYFTGEEFFQHEFPHERSDLSHWRKRRDDKLELLFPRACGWRMRAARCGPVTLSGHGRPRPKNITFPTDAKLLHAAIRDLILIFSYPQAGPADYPIFVPKAEVASMRPRAPCKAAPALAGRARSASPRIQCVRSAPPFHPRIP
jgi:hypothetical protein